MNNTQVETTISSLRVYDGKVINLRVDTILLPDGKEGKREIVEHRGAVAIVPFLNRDTVIMVRQYRSAAGASLLEIPAGTRDSNEAVDVCAHRELVEEINYKAGQMIKLFESYMAPGYSTEVIHTFAALDLTPEEGHADEDEFIEIVPVALGDAMQMIRNGEIIDAKSISALLYVEKWLAELA